MEPHPLIAALIARRKRLRMSKLALARRACLCPASLYRREKVGRWGDIEVLERWCAALGLRLSLTPIDTAERPK